MRILTLIGALAVIAVVAAAVFFFGGFYNVAATEPDPGVVHWALVQIRAASIDRHAVDQPPAGYDDPAKIQDGARVYSTIGCINCHGVPVESGTTWAKFSEGLHPEPPGLKELAADRTPAQLFWVLKNGINMTGMPSFALAGAKDEDLWSIVAFIKKLPIISDADYKTWTSTTAAPPTPTPTPSK